ncbi:FBD-associated F-box protein At5g56370-like [Carex rostrata]
MASSHSKSKSVVSLSDLPDEVVITVLSLLPTCKAASTSVISRRFRHLWKASPSVDLSLLKSISRSSYVTMANSSLLSRTRSSSNSLLRLRLDLGYPVSLYHLTDSFFCSLLVHAHALGLRHLTIDGNWDFVDFEPILCSVFSISSLESLSINILPITCPYTITLTRLKSLSINLVSYNSTQVQELLSELCCLEDLHLRITYGFDVVCLSSRTIKKLNLLLLDGGPTDYHEPDSLVLTMPSLELLCLTNLSFRADVPLIHGEIPLIRKAVLTLDCLCRKHVTEVAQFLNCISHVEELSLNLKEKEHMEVIMSISQTLFLSIFC